MCEYILGMSYEHKKTCRDFSDAEGRETEAIMREIRPRQLIVSNPGKWSPALIGFFGEEWNAVAKSSTYHYR